MRPFIAFVLANRKEAKNGETEKDENPQPKKARAALA